MNLGSLKAELKAIQEKISSLRDQACYLQSEISRQQNKCETERTFDNTLLNLLQTKKRPPDLREWKLSAGNINDECDDECKATALKDFVMHEILHAAKEKGQENGDDFDCEVIEDAKESEDGIYALVTCNVIKKEELPQVEYPLTKELVSLKVSPKISMRNEDLSTRCYSIAQFRSSVNNMEKVEPRGGESDNDAAVVVVFWLLTAVFKKMNHELRKGTKLKACHLTGLLPSERSFYACANYSPSPHFNPFFPPRQWPYPEVVPNDFVTATAQRLSPEQSHVVSLIPRLDPGLYCINGPPGTGKTTMNAEALMSLMIHCKTKRYMFAAHSNAAVIAGLKRLNGLLSTAGNTWLQLAFVGSIDKLAPEHRNLAVSSFSDDLERPFRKYLRKSEEQEGFNIDAEGLVKRLQKAKEKINSLLTPGYMAVRVIGKVEEVISTLDKYEVEIKKLSASLRTSDNLTELLKKIINAAENSRNCLEMFHIQRANVVFCTLCSSGRKLIRKCFTEIDVLVVDEASQATAADTLIPISYFTPRVCVLVGDEKQLPPVVSPRARNKGYEQSLMRSENGHSLKLLRNYRMNEDLLKFPSMKYYNSELIISDYVRARPDIHLTASACAPSFYELPSAFFDISGQEEKVGTSYRNKEEGNAIVSTVKKLLGQSEDNNAPSIGVIAAYQAQAVLINGLLKSDESLPNVEEEVTVATVDGFQGDERDIIIISTVRTRNGDAGFLKDSRRINVALTRARHKRWVFGHRESLESSQTDLSDFLRQPGEICNFEE